MLRSAPTWQMNYPSTSWICDRFTDSVIHIWLGHLTIFSLSPGRESSVSFPPPPSITYSSTAFLEVPLPITGRFLGINNTLLHVIDIFDGTMMVYVFSGRIIHSFFHSLLALYIVDTIVDKVACWSLRQQCSNLESGSERELGQRFRSRGSLY